MVHPSLHNHALVLFFLPTFILGQAVRAVINVAYMILGMAQLKLNRYKLIW